MSDAAKRKRESDASPAEFYRRTLTGGNVWDSLVDLQEIMQLRAKAKDDTVEFQNIVQHLFMNIVEPTQSKRKDQWAGARIDLLLLELIDEMQQVWKDMDSLGRAQEIAKTAIEAHEKSKSTELRESRPGRRVAKKGARWENEKRSTYTPWGKALSGL